MNSEKIMLTGCGILKKEIEMLIRKNKWNIETRFICSSLHIDFDQLEKALIGSLKKQKQQNKIVFYGTCHPRMDEIISDNNTKRTTGQNCVEILLGKKLFTEKLRSGAFFLMEDWAKRWDIVSQKAFGAKKNLMKEIFQQEHKYLLCVKTPVSGDFIADATKVSENVGLPIKWLNVNLQRLEKQLKTIINNQ